MNSSITTEKLVIFTDTFSMAHDCLLCQQVTLTYRDPVTACHYCLSCLGNAVHEAEMDRHAAEPNWRNLLGAVADENWRLLNGAIGAASDQLPTDIFMDAMYPSHELHSVTSPETAS